MTTKVDRHERIAPTAYFTSYTWHRLGLPYAELFATARGARLYWSLRFGFEWMVMIRGRLPTMAQYLGQRHRVIDWALDGYGADRVAEIGAGLSRRGVTWAADRDARYAEIDLPHMIAAKQALIAERAPAVLRGTLAARLSHHSIDVLDPSFGDRLAALLEGSRRPAVVAEGLLGYLTIPQRTALLGSIRGALARSGGGVFICDSHLADARVRLGRAAKIMTTLIGLLTRGQGVREPFADGKAAEAAYRAAGFAGVERFQPLELLDRVSGLARVYAPVNIYRLTAEAS